MRLAFQHAQRYGFKVKTCKEVWWMLFLNHIYNETNQWKICKHMWLHRLWLCLFRLCSLKKNQHYWTSAEECILWQISSTRTTDYTWREICIGRRLCGSYFLFLFQRSVSCFSDHVLEPVIPIRVVALIVGPRGPVRLVLCRDVHERLCDASCRRPLLSLCLPHPLLHLQLDQSPLVHGGNLFEGVQEFQHLIVHFVDLSLDSVALAGDVEEERNVVLAGDH